MPDDESREDGADLGAGADRDGEGAEGAERTSAGAERTVGGAERTAGGSERITGAERNSLRGADGALMAGAEGLNEGEIERAASAERGAILGEAAREKAAGERTTGALFTGLESVR